MYWLSDGWKRAHVFLSPFPCSSEVAKKNQKALGCDKSIFNRHRRATWPDRALGFQLGSVQPTCTLKSEQHVCETCVSELCVGRVDHHLSVWGRGGRQRGAGVGGRRNNTGVHQCLMRTGVSVWSSSCHRHPFRGSPGVIRGNTRHLMLVQAIIAISISDLLEKKG